MKRLLTTLMLLAAVVAPASATVDLTLFNTFALLDSDNSTPLEGISTGGDLVQLILVGPNGVIDPPSLSGTPSGDDALLFTTHVEAGLTTTNTGHLVQSSILYADAFGGNSNAYVRFWNSNTVGNANYYGTSTVFTLPAGDAFGLAEYDFGSAASFAANIPFSTSSAVPEPSNLFLIGIVVLAGYLYRRHKRGMTIALAFLALTQIAHAQLAAPLDVTTSAAIRNHAGVLLTGNNPVLAGTSNCLVQIINVGTNGVPDLPNLDGSPGGDDTVLATTVIGQGIALDIAQSGKFSTSFYPPPTGKVYARVFNAPSLAAATHYGQSATFTPHNSDVFDLSARGVSATTQPKGSDPTATDSDGDGRTDYQELVANTNPLDPGDQLDIGGIAQAAAGQPVNVSVAGKSGRQYTLQRTTDDLSGPVTWSDIVSTDVLDADQVLPLSDPSPPNAQKAFYRVKVTMP